jgi:hypothetical protein
MDNLTDWIIAGHQPPGWHNGEGPWGKDFDNILDFRDIKYQT